MAEPRSLADRDFRGSESTDPHRALRGRRIAEVLNVDDSDRGEYALLLDNGDLIMLSCDPDRDTGRWGVVLYDATRTPAGSQARSRTPRPR